MDEKRALKVIRECVRAEIQRIAVDANLHDKWGASYSFAVKASQRRAELQQALLAIEELVRARIEAR